MKRVYLDWGVVSNLKKPEYAEIKDFLLTNKGNLFFVYSTAHFEDAMRSRGDDRLMQDIQMLESLVDNHLLAYQKNSTHPFLLTPTEYYQNNKDRDLDTVPDFADLVSSVGQDNPMLGGLLKSFLSFPMPIPNVAREEKLFGMMLPDLPDSPTLGDVLHSSTTFINKMLGDKEYYKSYRYSIRSSGFTLDENSGNWKSDEVVSNISAQMKKLGIDKSFQEFVLSGFGNKDKVSDYEFFMAAYSMLDLIGYKSDKLPKSTNAMNSVTTDAQHAYYAAFCDYLVTQDSHLASKARALFSEFGISTKVISPADIIPELEENRKEELVSFLGEQLREENVERHEERAVVYKFTRRFLGIFTHCVVYANDDETLIELKLAFDNYSYFVFYDEARIMVDRVADYLGRPTDGDYDAIRQSIVSGNPNAAIHWKGDHIFFTLKADPERHRPELYINVPTQANTATEN